MDNSFPELPRESAGLLTLGVALGENLAFGTVSGRTAAAQAACLQRLRDDKLFQALEPTWEQFCPKYLKISRAEADRTIRLWEEFGAGYFEMAQWTRVSAETYRAIAPAVKDGALHVDGETIQLNAENSRRVSAAVARLRRVIPRQAKSPHTPAGPAACGAPADLYRRGMALFQEMKEACRQRPGDCSRFAEIFRLLQLELTRMMAENGPV
jgi:hypothetical protein